MKKKSSIEFEIKEVLVYQICNEIIIFKNKKIITRIIK